MKGLIICGSHLPTEEDVQQTLFGSGLNRISTENQTQEPANLFLDNILGEAAQNSKAALTITDARSTERWRAAALDLLTAKQPWGWLDARHARLLDFWKDLDPEIGFLLLYGRPELSIGYALQDTSKEFDQAEQAIMSWERYNRTLLHFHLHHRERSLLVNYENARANPAEFIDLCHKHFALELNEAPSRFEAANDIAHSIPEALAGSALLPHPAVQDLFIEMEAAANYLGKEATPLFSELEDRLPPLLQIGWSQYRGFKKDCDERLQRLDAAIAKATEGQQALSGMTEEKLQLEKENEEYIEQLHQVQEELEKLFEQKSSLDKLKISYEKQLALLQSTKTKEPDDTPFQQKITRLESENKDLTDENELLLLQLHQVQEELENYFIRNQELEDANRHGGGALLHLQADSLEAEGRYATDNYKDVTWIARGIRQGERQWTRLKFKSALYGDRPALEFRPDPEGAGADFVHWPEGAQDDYGRYLLLIPNPSEGMQAEQAKIFAELSTADWLLAKETARFLSDMLVKNRAIIAPECDDIDTEAWRTTSIELNRGFQQYPDTVRFDELRLREERRDAGYEHLWLEMNNLSHGEQLFETYGFKIAATGLRENSPFAPHAHLEFRAQQDERTPLQTWPPASVDEHGPVFTLGFDLLKRGMDLNAWETLDKQDREFIASLIERLPDMLKRLQKNSAETKRPWTDWLQLAQSLQSTHQRILKREERNWYRRLRQTKRALSKRRKVKTHA